MHKGIDAQIHMQSTYMCNTSVQVHKYTSAHEDAKMHIYIHGQVYTCTNTQVQTNNQTSAIKRAVELPSDIIKSP